MEHPDSAPLMVPSTSSVASYHSPMETLKKQVKKEKQQELAIAVASSSVAQGTGNRLSLFSGKVNKKLSFAAIFEEVLANKRQSPLSLKDFKAYLAQTFTSELLDFCDQVSKFKSLGSTPEGAKAVINDFIKIGSPSEINISDLYRKAILASYESGNITESMFDQAYTEAMKLLREGAFVTFYTKVTTANLSKRESEVRLWRGLTAGAMVIGFGAILIYLEFDGIIPSHWFRLLLLPLVFLCTSWIMQYRKKVCQYCASKGITTVLSVKTLKQAWADGETVAVTDELVREAINSILTRAYFEILLITVLVMGAIIAIPPYDNFTFTF